MGVEIQKGKDYYAIPNGNGKVLHTNGDVKPIRESGWVWTPMGLQFVEED